LSSIVLNEKNFLIFNLKLTISWILFHKVLRIESLMLQITHKVFKIINEKW
jgi:hypothetical protein